MTTRARPRRNGTTAAALSGSGAAPTLERAAPPIYSEDAEQAVLSALLIDTTPAGIDTVRSMLAAGDFYVDRHRRIFAAQIALRDANWTIDPLTVTHELERRGELELVGGKDYIGFLVDAVPTDKNVEYHARIVHEKAAYRELGAALRDGGLSITELSRQLIARVGRLPSATGRRFSLRRLMQGEAPAAPALLVEQLLLDADLNVLGGGGGAGKSTIAQSISICTILGRPVFGTRAIRRPGPVVLLVPEDGEAVARHHCEAIAASMNLTADERRTLERDLHIIGDERPMNLLTDTPELRELITPVRPSLFVADPLGNLLGGADENDQRVAAAVCDNLRREIARPLSTAILIAGHLRKPGRETDPSIAADVSDFKGSVGWTNHARMVWTVTKPKDGDLITLRLVKSNRIRTGTEHQITVAIEADADNEAHWRSCRLTDANLGAASVSLTPGVGRAINANERKMLEALVDAAEPERRVSRSEWLKLSGLKTDTWKTIKNRLHSAGLTNAEVVGVNRNGKSKTYNYGITEKGARALETGWVDVLSRGEGVKG
jgi:hypothetical protein